MSPKRLAVLFTFFGCATQMPPERPRLEEYLVDGDTGFMRGHAAYSDFEISQCYRPQPGAVIAPVGRRVCYAMLQADYKALLDYVVTLEQRLEACQHPPALELLK